MAEDSYQLKNREDYDLSLRMGNRSLKAYSRDKMRTLYPTGSFSLVGEAVYGKARDQRSHLQLFEHDENPLSLAPFQTYSRLFYRSLGFVLVDEDKDRYAELLRPRRALWLLMALALVALLSTLVILIFFRQGDQPRHPDYLVPDREPHASVMKDDDSEKASKDDGGGTVSMIYKRRVYVDLESGDLSLYFANPNHSNHDVALQLIIKSGDKEVIIAESGLLQAGYSLEKLKLKEDVIMEKGGYDAYFNVDYYDSDTGERALVKANIPVSVEVE